MAEQPDVRSRVGRNVQRVRRARGISQERLAELAGNTAKHIGQIERGQVNVGIDILARIAEALAVDVSALFALRGRRHGGHPVYLCDGGDLDRLEEILRTVRRAPLFPADNEPT